MDPERGSTHVHDCGKAQALPPAGVLQGLWALHRGLRQALHRARDRDQPPDGAHPGRPEPRELLGLRPLHDRLPGALRPRAGARARTSSSRTRRSSSARRPFARRDAGADPGRASSRCRRRGPSSPRAPTPPRSARSSPAAGTSSAIPITPSTEGAELMAKLLPQLDGVFVQAVSEVATVNMMYGCGGAGLRAMTFTSSPGFSLMLEGISYMIGAELPGVFVNVMRGGPGLGNIAPGAGRHQARLPRARPRQHARRSCSRPRRRRRCSTSRCWPSSSPSSTATRS